MHISCKRNITKTYYSNSVANITMILHSHSTVKEFQTVIYDFDIDQ